MAKLFWNILRKVNVIICVLIRKRLKKITHREKRRHTEEEEAVWPWSQVEPASPEAGRKGKR